MSENVISANMLGGFALSYNGKKFSIERNSATKVNQLLQLLLYFPRGIDRSQLLEYLFDGEVVTNPSNSLRALVFRLRKILPQNGIPDDDFVYISRGVYSWTQNIAVECDAHIFEELVAKANETEAADEKAAILHEAWEIFDGGFLPMLADVEWARQVDLKLKELYQDAIKQLLDYYVENEDYDQLLTVSEKAAKIYPYNEWQCYQMQALIELKRDKEAILLYEKTENMMFAELGVSVSSQMTAMLDRLGAQVKNRTDLISTVKNNLDNTKKEEDGAFYCSYPVFLESYRYIKRVIARTKQPAWLMLCTITDGKGVALDSGERLEELAAELADSISKSVRGGDMYTRYSDNQFIILLFGIEKDDCGLVQSRISKNMSKESRKRYLQYHLAPVNQKNSKQGLEDIIRELDF